MFAEVKRARTSQINRVNVLAAEGIPPFDSHAVVVSENVTVGVKAGKLGEELRRLQRDYRTELKIAKPHASRGGRRKRAVQHKSVADVVSGIGLLLAEISAILRNQHKTGIRPVVDRMRKRIADSRAEVAAVPFVH